MKTNINADPLPWPWLCTAKPCFSKIASLDFHVDGNTIAGNVQEAEAGDTRDVPCSDTSLHHNVEVCAIILSK